MKKKRKRRTGEYLPDTPAGRKGQPKPPDSMQYRLDRARHLLRGAGFVEKEKD